MYVCHSFLFSFPLAFITRSAIGFYYEYFELFFGFCVACCCSCCWRFSRSTLFTQIHQALQISVRISRVCFWSKLQCISAIVFRELLFLCVCVVHSYATVAAAMAAVIAVFCISAVAFHFSLNPGCPCAFTVYLCGVGGIYFLFNSHDECDHITVFVYTSHPPVLANHPQPLKWNGLAVHTAMAA